MIAVAVSVALLVLGVFGMLNAVWFGSLWRYEPRARSLVVLAFAAFVTPAVCFALAAFLLGLVGPAVLFAPVLVMAGAAVAQRWWIAAL